MTALPKGYLTLCLFSLLLVSFKNDPGRNNRVVRLGDGVIVFLKNPAAGSVKLQVVTDQIIHVTASADSNFSSSPSLMVLNNLPTYTKWTSEESEETVTVKTSSISASLIKSTGEVVFRDKAGKIILQEKLGGGKSFDPVVIDNKPLYRIRQVFESPADEAFYGLGQHQEGLMNYKGYDVDLTQYNSVVALPFVVSSRNYGILWDNYSITQFGDNRNHLPIGLNAVDMDGKSGGLTATYSDRKDTVRIYLRRQESDIDYSFLHSLQQMPAGFPMDKGRITWEGFLQPAEDGIHKFFLKSSGYLKIWVDEKLIFNKWREGWNPGPSQFHIDLKKDKRHHIRMEWIPESGQAFCDLKFLGPEPDSLKNTLSLSSEAGEKIDYYFLYGKNLDEVICDYRQLTGKATLIPKWALGFWQSRERYKTQAEIEQTVSEFRKRKIPLDNIVLDWSYWKEDQWGSQEFDSTRFPDATGMIQSLHDKYHTQFMISVWPKFYEGINTYNYFNQHNWLYRQNIIDRQRDWIGKGYVSTFYDAFNPDARKAFWNLLNEKLFSKKIDAWWLDAPEPDILSNASIEHRKKLMNPTALGPADQYFNAYPLVHASGIYEGQRQVNPDQRVFILTRSAYPGIQRYAAATWSGDIAARFDELERQIPAGLNFSLSGLPWWTTDIGGFFVEDKYDRPNPKGDTLEEWRELNTRWYQFGSFCPLFRSHGQYPYREIFNIAPENHPAYKSMLYYNKLRYRLMPYLYSLAGETYHSNYTIMRALVMDFPGDTAVRNIGDQYLLGPALLINPVYKYKATNRELYLPSPSNWYDLYTGKWIAGGQRIRAAAPYGRIPVYVREGSVIPVGPEMQYTSEKAADPITLYVYTGGNADFTLYEDEGTNYGYEKGLYSIIRFSYNEQKKQLTIGERERSFPGMLQSRHFKVIWISKEKPAGIDQPATAITVMYSGKSITVNAK
jgi:alpha-D-xyloside xylohydrolase